RPRRAGGLRALGRVLLVGRLAVRDLRRRRIETALLLLAIMAATTTLTLGLVLHKAASDPYQSPRAATNGPAVGAGASRSASPSGRATRTRPPGRRPPDPTWSPAPRRIPASTPTIPTSSSGTS